jgi:hypothetical protein
MHRANDGRCECKYPLIDCDNQRHRAGDILAVEFLLGDQWRERGQIADSETEQNAPKRETQRSLTENQQQDTGDLHGKVGGGREPAIVFADPLAGCGPANDGTYRCQADKKSGMLNSELRRKASHQMGQQADLREESEKAAEIVMKREVRTISMRVHLGFGLAGARCDASPSGASPMSSGDLAKNLTLRYPTMATMQPPTRSAADGNPIDRIKHTHIGTNSTPPTLAPLNASAIAIGRSRSNHLATSAFSAAPLVMAQPAPLGIAAANNCHGSRELDHNIRPAAVRTAPRKVVLAIPSRRCISGKQAMTIALSRKWAVMANEICEMGQPRVWCSDCRNTEGP